MTVTLRDVALRAGVSTAATSQALNDRGNLSDDTRARIKAIAAELGYRPNRSAAALRQGRTMSIGFVMAEDAAVSRRRAVQRTRQLGALVSACAARGFTVTVLPDSRPDLLAGAQVDVLYFSDPADRREIVHEASALGIPVVSTDLYVASSTGLSIRTGYGDAVHAALDLLGGAGARRIGLLVDDAEIPRDQIGESAYLAWTAVRNRAPLIARVDADRHRLARCVRELLDAGADALVAFCEEGPDIYLQLETTGLVIPRDLQLVALCTTDCALNERLGVTRVCVHPERAPEAMFAALDEARTTTVPVLKKLPWELVCGSTTR